MDSHSQVNKVISTPILADVYIKIAQQRRLSGHGFDNSTQYALRIKQFFFRFSYFFFYYFRCLLLGEKYGSSSFRKKLKLARINFNTAGTYRIVARGKYCQFEKKVEVRVISKYYDNTVERFPLERRKHPHLLWLCITTLCDWLRELAPLSHRITSKTKTNGYSLLPFFPPFVPAAFVWLEF